MREIAAEVGAEVDAADNVNISRLPLVGPYINSLINRILDIVP